MADLINDFVIADLLVRLYAETSGEPHDEADCSFDVLDVGHDDGVCWAAKRINDITIILLRGSVTFEDWFRDFMAVANPFSHASLGCVHPGFMLGMDKVLTEVLALGPTPGSGPYIVAGHSLGAGRASILTGLMLLAGSPPFARVTFGEPKPGFAQLASLISRVPARSYRNGDQYQHDIVTDVPLSFPPEEYVHASPLTFVTAQPSLDLRTRLSLFALHHMPLYRQAMSVKFGSALK